MITYQGNHYEIEPLETVLDCLIRHGVQAPYACRSGLCHTCIMRIVTGEPTPESQKGLKAGQIDKNFFLPCSCVPSGDLEVVYDKDALFKVDTRVVSVEALTSEVTRLRLKVPAGYRYRAGQYLTLFNAEGVGRSYSLASLPGVDDYLELHVRRIAHGKVSSWVADQLHNDDQVVIGEALGDCIYQSSDKQQPLLMVGTGTGLAPLYGVLRDAMQQGHTGPIYLYHGSTTSHGLYLMEELRGLAETVGVHYVRSVSQELPAAGIRQGRANDLALQDNPKLTGWRIYLCGNEAMVKATQRAAFLAGASFQSIHADAFIHS